MTGLSGTLSVKSALTVIFWPSAGTLICWNIVLSHSSQAGRGPEPVCRMNYNVDYACKSCIRRVLHYAPVFSKAPRITFYRPIPDSCL
ncbi:hypothetical protein MASSI9I_20142 [Massilia sp. 9I]|nr:hypothetical protein MASSI9I_20142 [Massilia sp. 9I]